LQGESARLQSFVGAIAIADLVKTTLGPKGMDKIIQSVRAGGAEILTVIGTAAAKLATRSTQGTRCILCR